MDPNEELSIGAIAQRSGLAPSALRFYEDVGLIHARRTEGGQRRYRRDVLRRLAIIGAAQRVGFSLDDIAAMLDAVPEDHHVTEREWRALAKGWRPRIDEQIQVLERLRDQLDRCIGCGCLSLATCQLANADDRAGAKGAGPRFWPAAARR